jgi:hypothetical protein
MSLYRQAPEGWQPKATYQNFLAKRVPAAEHESETFSQRVDRVASTFLPEEVRLIVGHEVIGRQVDLNDGLHHVAEVPEYLYDRYYESGVEDA